MNGSKPCPMLPTAGDAPRGEAEQPNSLTILQKLLDEQLTPLREQVKRLESQLHAVAGSK
jgi:hypothetical protein